MERIRATVKIRRGDGWDVRPEAEELDGRTFDFTYGWEIDDRKEYVGEIAWIIDRKHLPEIGEDAPIWLASGDLIPTQPQQGER